MGVFDFAKAKVSQGAGVANNLMTNHIGQAEAGALKAGLNGLNSVLNNDIAKTGLNAINQVQGLVNGVQGLIGAARSFLADPRQVVPNPLWGGFSRQAVQKQAQLALSIAYAKNNLFLVRLIDNHYPSRDNGARKYPDTFDNDNVWDLFAMGVSYAPIAITGDTVKLGLLQGDNIQQSERVEIRMTLFDRADGLVKRYLMEKKKQMVNRDGTANPPALYVLELEIIHLDQSYGTTQISGQNIGVFDLDALIHHSYIHHKYLVRVANLDIDLNKREDSLQELQTTFVEVDPFMMPDRG